MKHFLVNSSSETVCTFEKFDKGLIKDGIVKYLSKNPTEELTHEKELVGKDKLKYAGNETLNFYTNHLGRPCIIILKGGKEFYKPLKLN